MATESVGPYLRKARESQGFSLDQVTALTRIQLKYLQALEEEDFAALPQQVFTRGFVRTYARSLGLNEKDVLDRFSEASSDFYEGGELEQEQVHQRIEEERQGKLNKKVVIIIIGVILLALALVLPRQREPVPPFEPDTTSNPSVGSPVPSEEAPEAAPLIEEASEPILGPDPKTVLPVPTAPPAALPAVAEPAKVKQPTPSPVLSPGSPLLMELEATQLTWVVVKTDENEPQEALLKPRQRVSWKAKNQFTLTLGNAGGVLVWINGEPRGPFGKQGEVVREVFIRNEEGN